MLVPLAVGLLLAAVLLGGGQAQAAGPSSPTLQPADGYTEYVLSLAMRGIIKRQEDPATSPADLVTRRQMAVYLARILRLPDEPFAALVDVRPSDWGVGEIGAVRREGIMNGDSLVAFGPDRPVSRQEAASLVIAALRYSAEKQGAVLSDPLTPYRVDECLAGFADRNLIGANHVSAVAVASRLGLLPPTDMWLLPSMGLTHRELVPMLAKAFVEPLSPSVAYTAAVDPIKAYPNLAKGSKGPFVLLLEQKLTALHYPCGPVDGKYDFRTRDAVMAFQKYERMRRTGKVDAQFWQRFFVAQPPKPVKQGSGDRLEADLTRQILMMIRDEKVVMVLHVSTGKYGTPTGGWHLRSKNRGWVTCSLGPIYSPCYFMPKNAIHGYPSVPTYPASHGCIRTPIWLQDVLFSYLSVGMPVDVFYNRAK
jgi:Putative peptidoglycan binding domain/L,D-transpeptidase catalytic domain/S-layer homology domain